MAGHGGPLGKDPEGGVGAVQSAPGGVRTASQPPGWGEVVGRGRCAARLEVLCTSNW